MSHDNQILILLVALFVKHFVCDFFLQNGFMLSGKGKSKLDFVIPLSAHCIEHAAFTSLIFLPFGNYFYLLGILDFIAHFVVDRIKAITQLPAGAWIPEDKIKNLNRFYFLFGLDQLFHSLTYLLIIFIFLNLR